MFSVRRGSLAVAALLFFCLIGARGSAYGVIMSLDGKDDAGLFAGQEAYLRYAGTGANLPLGVAATDHTQFTSAQQVYDYAFTKGITSTWWLESAGNIWASDLIVGESLTNLSDGVYRISVADGTFKGYQYDSFGWSDDRDKWWWQLHILATNAYSNGQPVSTLGGLLGTTSGYGSANAAFQAVEGSYLDITLAQGGSLNFWIWDVNSIDNAGGLNFSVTRVPEPSALLLLAIGLPGLLWRARR